VDDVKQELERVKKETQETMDEYANAFPQGEQSVAGDE
jgi:hypothetical protein